MPRLPMAAPIAFVPALFAVWFVHVVGRAGNGPGFRWDRLLVDGRATVAVTGTLYAVAALVALGVLYVARGRAHPAGAQAVLLPTLGGLAVAYVAALVVGVPLAEAYCVADERAFRREARAAHAAPAAGGMADDTTFYSRTRWWPGDAQILVSESPPPR